MNDKQLQLRFFMFDIYFHIFIYTFILLFITMLHLAEIYIYHVYIIQLLKPLFVSRGHNLYLQIFTLNHYFFLYNLFTFKYQLNIFFQFRFRWECIYRVFHPMLTLNLYLGLTLKWNILYRFHIIFSCFQNKLLTCIYL